MEMVKMDIKSDTYMLTPPLFQPRRLWTRRRTSSANGSSVARREPTYVNDEAHLPRMFLMKGGFVSNAAGERRLVIVGKLVRIKG